MPTFKHHVTSFRFWLTLFAATVFTMGAIRASAAAGLIITSPSANQVISGNQVAVNLEASGVQLADYRTHAKTRLGQGHLHLWLDQTNPTAASAIKVTSPSYTFDNVKSGPHTLVVELVNNDHTSLSPKVTTAVSFKTRPASSQISSLNLIFLPLTALVLILATLMMLSPQLKTSAHSRTTPKKSARKHSRRK